jgi:hypothetical protein
MSYKISAPRLDPEEGLYFSRVYGPNGVLLLKTFAKTKRLAKERARICVALWRAARPVKKVIPLNLDRLLDPPECL